MGHLYRTLNFIQYLNARGHSCIVLINENESALAILKTRNVSFEFVNLSDVKSNWEEQYINQYSITCWINDRLDTCKQHSTNVKNTRVPLVTLDDFGGGGEQSDLLIFGLCFEPPNIIATGEILWGPQYLILNPEIEKLRRYRERADDGSDLNILVTLGGSDTFGVTIAVVNELKKYSHNVTVITGASFIHTEELNKILPERYIHKHNVPSLIQEISQHDLIVCGGGVTPFEAAALGVPSYVIANEKHEIPVGNYLEHCECSKFLGHYLNWNSGMLENCLSINDMSKKALKAIPANGITAVYAAVMKLMQ